MIQQFPKVGLQLLIKVNMQLLPYDSTIELLCIYLKEIKTGSQKNLYENIHSSLFIKVKNGKTQTCFNE